MGTKSLAGNSARQTNLLKSFYSGSSPALLLVFIFFDRALTDGTEPAFGSHTTMRLIPSPAISPD
jgi:hypothetical protein